MKRASNEVRNYVGMSGCNLSKDKVPEVRHSSCLDALKILLCCRKN